jgi:hypothetical protein
VEGHHSPSPSSCAAVVHSTPKTEPWQLGFKLLTSNCLPALPPSQATQTRVPTISNKHSPTPSMLSLSKYNIPHYAFAKMEPRQLHFVELASTTSPLCTAQMHSSSTSNPHSPTTPMSPPLKYEPPPHPMHSPNRSPGSSVSFIWP